MAQLHVRPPTARLRTLPRLLRLSWQADRRTFVLWCLLNSVMGLYAVAQVQVLRRLVETAQQAMQAPSSHAALLVVPLAWGAGLAALGLLRSAIDAVQDVVNVRYQERLRMAVEERLYRQTQAVALERLEEADYHDQLQRVRSGIDGRLSATVYFVWGVMTGLIALISLLIYLVQFSWWLPALLTLGTTVAVLIERRYNLLLWRSWRDLSAPERRLNVYDGLLTGRGAAAEVRPFGFGEWLIGRSDRLRRQVADTRLQVAAHISRLGVLSNIIKGLTYGAAIVISVALFVAGRIGVGAAAAIFSAIEGFQQSYRDLIWNAAVVYDDLRYIEEFFDFIDTPRLDLAAGRRLEGPVKEGIVFDDVSFTYPGSAQPALSRLRLTIRAGERIALVGENGAGKSTLVKLVMGLYRPTAGRILVDGIDLQEIAPENWCVRIGAVFQDFTRYQTTVRENVAMGWIERRDDSALVEAAAARGGALQVAAGLPNGLDTPLGEAFQEGVDLSVGQWQKLAIARAYLRPAELLILDEPASALDAKAEAEVYSHFAAMAQERTVILISHRLGFCRIAGRILVLDHGRLIEEGTHAALLAAGGTYAELYRLQTAWYR